MLVNQSNHIRVTANESQSQTEIYLQRTTLKIEQNFN